MSSEEWMDAMKELLDSADSNGDYCVSYRVNLPALHPRICIKGSEDERLAFPLPPSQAKSVIIPAAEKAPYGKGSETCLDENVRRAWQLDPKKITFEDPQQVWSSTVRRIAQEVRHKLGVTSSVQANLYKMLLYEKDGHFVKHCDTEKEPGMFGTMILHLPCKYTGGELVVEHKGQKKIIDYSDESQDGFFVTAFYADCEHELKPLTSGYRLCLVYNLVVSSSKTSASVEETDVPSAENLAANLQNLQQLVKEWNDGSYENDVCGYLLDHKYTKTNLHFSQLKGQDKEVVDLLRTAKDENGRPLLTVCLVLLEKHESGSAECGYSYYRGRGDRGPHIMEEVHETTYGNSHWIGSDDKILNNLKIPFHAESCLLLDDEEYEDIFEEDPDNEEYESYTGNAGPSLEYWYYRSAVVFWPYSKHLNIAQKAGLSYLTSLLLSKDTQQEELVQVAEIVVQIIEKEKKPVSNSVLRGLLRTEDLSLILRSLKFLHFTSDARAVEVLSSIISSFPDSSELQEEIVRICGASSNFKSTINYYSSDRYITCIMSCNLVRELEKQGQKELAGKCCVAIVTEALKNVDIVFQNKDCITAITKFAFELGQDHFQGFVDETLERAKGHALSVILENLSTYPKAIKNEQVRRLYDRRMAQLKAWTANGKPFFTWRQSTNSGFPGSNATAVLNFLASNEVERTLSGYNGIGHARNWSNKYFPAGNRYCVRAIPGGIGQRACVTLTKTRGYHKKLTEQYEGHLREISKWQSVFGVISNHAKRAISDTAAEPAQSDSKKTRSEEREATVSSSTK